MGRKKSTTNTENYLSEEIVANAHEGDGPRRWEIEALRNTITQNLMNARTHDIFCYNGSNNIFCYNDSNDTHLICHGVSFCNFIGTNYNEYILYHWWTTYMS